MSNGSAWTSRAQKLHGLSEPPRVFLHHIGRQDLLAVMSRHIRKKCAAFHPTYLFTLSFSSGFFWGTSSYMVAQ